MALRMPPEWGPHERTLMAWPCRAGLWRARMADARAEYAAVANAVCAFEDLTLVCATEADAADARAAVSARAEVLVAPIDDSWLRDSGPIFVTGDGRREAVHFGFNAWGEKFPPWDQDAVIGRTLGEHVGDAVRDATDLVLEGGSLALCADGTLLTTEQCLLSPSRNPALDRAAIEARVLSELGAQRMVWLGEGLVEDRDTDGHVDLVAVPLPDGRVLLQSRPEGDVDHEPMAENHRRARAAGLDVVPFEPLARFTVDGEDVAMSYLNLTYVNGAVVVGQAGQPDVDEPALAAIAAVLPDHEVVGVPAATIAYGGGGPHCITQQVPVLRTRGSAAGSRAAGA